MQNVFKPADILSLGFIALLSFVTVLFIPALGAWGRILATYALLALTIVSLAVYRKRRRTGNCSSALYPAVYVVIILVIFNSLGDLIPSLWGRTFDEALIRTDVALFGVHPTLWMEKLINPMLTTLLQLAYISYYFIPLSLGAVLIIKHRDRELDESLFGIVLCFYLSYVGYLLVPAIGPRFTLAHLQTVDLQAGPVTQAIQNILNGLEHNKTDAFPSGHTAVALMTLFYAWKWRERTLFRILLPLVSLLIFSTVYLRYHYVIDVIAGVLLTVLTISLAPRAYRFLSPGPPQGQFHHGA
jgi:membrane-associated phospholipid phosphatase